ncbi:phosphonate ABC transporter, permease protein PhnE [Halodesulfovibrio marinisediminis]|uniref:Phosphonate transport system permease protein n=1 Tax=Halodesulfovibrio marinisediminis DSM 17456 TaxID=1121457 RepID=A0A1N6DWQ1_9BACT|nr:phosphonate ABC transporter, permease protein PhnE [Halodesulfovibrio marinisediminis]SIN75216.1 phosphonate transport system permease protein [Halodesulfovibrio marinisediminis DSM 17456]
MTDLTLDQLTPKKNLSQKAVIATASALIATVLVITYIWCGIDPIKLYEKRQNAAEYLFGHAVTQSDKNAALEQASRLPAIIVRQEAIAEVRNRMKAEGNMDFTEMTRKGNELAQERLANLDPATKQAIIDEEYTRVLDEKRGGFFPPEMRPEPLFEYTKALVETLAIAIWGTLIAFIASIPASMFAARNTLKIIIPGSSPVRKKLRRTIQFSMRRLLDFCRGFNEFVMALIFVAVIGLGPYAGVLALAIHSFGILGKVFSEGIEAIEPGQVEAVEASGSSSIQTIAFSVLPQIMPLVASYSLLRFETNVRSATILGFVGAGGLGFLIFDKLNGYLYREVCTMMIMVILMVTIIDYLCGKIRRKFV